MKLSVAGMLLLFTGRVFAAATDVEYRGFHVDDSQIVHLQNRSSIHAAMREQIDMVCEVKISPELLDFFRTVRLLLEPAAKGVHVGRYAFPSKTIKITSDIVLVGHRPLLLHEFIHAFHGQKLEDGILNGVIINLYQQAKKVGGFASEAHMMDYPSEYFACAAATYLFGVTNAEPKTRARIREIQPELFAYLRKTFGEQAETYIGVLRDPEPNKALEPNRL